MTDNGLPPGTANDRSAPWSDEAYWLAEEQECDELTPDSSTPLTTEECICEHGIDLLGNCPECLHESTTRRSRGQKSSEDKLVDFIKSDIRNIFDGYMEGLDIESES